MISRSLAFVAAVAVSCTGSLAHAQKPQEQWLKYLEGDWKWERSDGETGTLTYVRTRADVEALTVLLKQDGPAPITSVGVLGWNFHVRKFVNTGYSSDGGFHTVTYGKVEAGTMEENGPANHRTIRPPR